MATGPLYGPGGSALFRHVTVHLSDELSRLIRQSFRRSSTRPDPHTDMVAGTGDKSTAGATTPRGPPGLRQLKALRGGRGLPPRPAKPPGTPRLVVAGHRRPRRHPSAVLVRAASGPLLHGRRARPLGGRA